MPAHKTSAWLLALIYAALVVYASLYPFSDWRSQDIAPWLFIINAPPWYWSHFDIAVNIVGYAPLGFLLCVAHIRRSRSGAMWRPVWRSVAGVALLSLGMETIQSYLPMRVPSTLDLVTNVLGGGLGAGMAVALARLGLLVRWGRFRSQWFEPGVNGELVLLALWPCALFFPLPFPLGLGQVLERVEVALAATLQDTPFLAWLPVREVEFQPLIPAAEVLRMALGLLLPCLLGYSVVRDLWRRVALLVVVGLLGVGVTAMSAALSAGPVHAWDWLDSAALSGLLIGVVMAGLLLPVPMAGCALLLLLALVTHASVLNQAAINTYFAQTLQSWEQGRFIRFFGLAQWLGWLWPYACLGLMLRRLWRFVQ